MKWKSALAVWMVTNVGYTQGVIINELMYAPSSGQPEWVELYNSGPDSINIKDWTICNKTGVRYAIRRSDSFIHSHSYLVLTNSNSFADYHPEAIGSFILVDWSQYFLVNTGDTVTLRDNHGRTVDSVYYTPSWGGSGGKSLERKSASGPSRTQNNWGSSIDPAGCTPGRVNSISLKGIDLRISYFSASYFSAESRIDFEVRVKNAGMESVPSFSLNVFIDYNGDSSAQSQELAGTTTRGPLDPGDSLQLRVTKEATYSVRTNAIAILDLNSDEDTTNNKMISKIVLSYEPGSFVVNEIMYAPASPQPEWVELYNSSSDSISLEGFTIGDNSGTISRMLETDRVLAPSAYAVIADDSTFFDYHSGLSTLVVVVPIPSLNNSGDAVIVRDPSGRTIDSVAYSPSWGGNSGGRSLERILARGGSNDPQNFETCVDTSKSTPGKINSVTPRDHDLAIGNVSWSPVLLQSGSTATITVNVLNVGLKISGSSAVILFKDLDNDLRLSAGEVLDSVDVGTIPAGDSASFVLRTGTLPFGSYRFGIIIHYAGDEKTSNNSKSFILKIGLPPSTVVVNELMYAPVSPEAEWIELYNTGGAPVDLSDFRISSHTSGVRIRSGTVIAPAGYLVLCKDSSVQRLHDNARNVVIQSVPTLNNGGAGVALHDNLGNLLDTIDYRPSFGGDTGRSLERIDYLAGNDSTNWGESVDTTGATPGTQNSIAILPFDVAIKRLDLSSASVAPGRTGTISVVVVNRGRNAAADVSVALRIERDLDSAQIHSETGRIARTIASMDSASIQFGFSPGSSGAHTVFARLRLDNDPRYWNDTLSAKLNVGFEPQSVVINEIMFTKGPMGEYFEIFNESPSPIDLTGWGFHTVSSSLKTFSQSNIPSFQHSIIPRLLPGSYFVIASDSSVLAVVPDTSAVSVVKSLTLRDDGDCVVLYDPSGNVVDSVYYLPSWHNADIANTAGRSLEKINPTLPSGEKTSWSTCVSKSGGTPGSRNSLFISPGQVSGSISVSPNPFSPDGDGHDDFTFVTYSFPVTSVKIRIRIFDTMGRSIATPADNIVVPSAGRLVWDGRDGSGKIVRFGLYILFMEVTGPDGNSLAIYKKPVVVAKKIR